MTEVNYNERSWAIDLISETNLWLSQRNISIKRAGGENTLKSGKKSLFPDFLLFGDGDKGRILQGWELKMPDTALEDEEFIKNAKAKAELLSLNSFLLWNVSKAILYKIEDEAFLAGENGDATQSLDQDLSQLLNLIKEENRHGYNAGYLRGKREPTKTVIQSTPWSAINKFFNGDMFEDWLYSNNKDDPYSTVKKFLRQRDRALKRQLLKKTLEELSNEDK